jgi:Fe-S-cluster-containing dehydrogenase component
MYGLRVFEDLCVGCPSCAAACQANKDLGMNAQPLFIEERNAVSEQGQPTLEFTLHACPQCEEAPCIGACPVHALFRVEHGVVVLDEDLCDGCRQTALRKEWGTTWCIKACPFPVLRLDLKRNIVAKCDMCLDRLENGRPAACVQACPAKVIYVGEVEEVEAQILERRARREALRAKADREAEERWREAGIVYSESEA